MPSDKKSAPVNKAQSKKGAPPKKKAPPKKQKEQNLPVIIVCIVLAALAVFLTVFFIVRANRDDQNATKISFKNAESYEALKLLNGQKVSINGYMATSSPADGSFLFLMNLPYQSCPFCKPNTSELANTMEVYPKKNAKFNYTTQAIKIVGTLVVADDPEQPFTDQYGYEFAFKIVDAEYKILKDSDLEIDVALWQSIASSGIVTDLNAMQDYIYFLSHWPEYFVDNTKDSKGFYLAPSDVKDYFLEPDGAQYHYGFADGYFDELIARLRAIDAEKLSDLIENVEKAKAFAEKAKAELYEGHYQSGEIHYIEKFDRDDYQYSLDKAEELDEECNEIYLEYSNWLASWEL